MKSYILIFITVFCSCKSNYQIQEPDKEFLRMLAESKQNDSMNVNFSGFYFNKTMSDEYKLAKEYYAVSPILFFNNGLVFYQNILAKDSIEFANLLSYANVKGDVRNWGAYSIVGDTISAVIYCVHARNKAQIFHYLPCHYKGYIKDSATIVDWKLIEPFPAINKKYEPNFLARETKPAILEFHKFLLKAGIDSNNVWINDLRKP